MEDPYKVPDHLSGMKTLQDAYKAFFIFRPIDWTKNLEPGLEEVHHGSTRAEQS